MARALLNSHFLPWWASQFNVCIGWCIVVERVSLSCVTAIITSDMRVRTSMLDFITFICQLPEFMERMNLGSFHHLIWYYHLISCLNYNSLLCFMLIGPSGLFCLQFGQKSTLLSFAIIQIHIFIALIESGAWIA